MKYKKETTTSYILFVLGFSAKKPPINPYWKAKKVGRMFRSSMSKITILLVCCEDYWFGFVY